jgi:hypothetical protein
MIKRILFLVLAAFVFLPSYFAAGETPPSLAVKGLVEQPLKLTLDDLGAFSSITVQLNEIMKDGGFQGNFYYRGVPLRNLLETARIQKKRKNFFKGIDLALAVRNKAGKQIVLSWGEIFYRNPATIVIATSAQPIMPHGECKSCHDAEFTKRWLAPLHRKVGFPKLVVTSDTWSDRSLDNVTEIEVVDLRPDLPSRKVKDLQSPEFEITGPGVTSVTVKDLSSFSRIRTRVSTVGEGKGYHGTHDVSGASLKDVLAGFLSKPGLDSAFLVSAPDGYRSILSFGEVFLSPAGERILLVDTINNEPVKENGKFIMMPPDDVMADRWIKAVSKIEWIPLPPK